ncbi:hypothetical protein GF371_01870 [Candidatus Woesearchaeota archaeon]|nr:hypothetical protein [Candidatus Woesearchaeota archaeon]
MTMLQEAKMNEQLLEVVEVLQEVLNDDTVPKNVKARIENAISELQRNDDRNIAIHKALNELDELADNTNIEPYTRSQIWNIVSLLESNSI